MDNSSRLDQRLKSVRCLGKGKFESYRKMFDLTDKTNNNNNEKNDYKINTINETTNNKNINKKFLKGISEDVNEQFYDDKVLDEMQKNDILQLPYTDDEKSSHLKNSKFGIYSKNNDKMNQTKNLSFDIHDSLNKKNSKLSIKNMDLTSDSNSHKNDKFEENSGKKEDFIDFKVKDKKNYFENRLKNLDDAKNSNLVTAKNRNLSKSCNFNEDIYKINPNIKASVNNLPQPEYVLMDDIELSDTSYDDDEDDNDDDDDDESDGNTIDMTIGDSQNNVKNIELNNFKNDQNTKTPPKPPPKKPNRTFEHDIYTTFKLDLNKAFSTNLPDFNELNIDSPPKNKSSIGSNKTLVNDHIYESLGSVQNFMNNSLNDSVLKKEKKINDESLKLSRSSNQSSNQDLNSKKGFNTKLKVRFFPFLLEYSVL